MPVKLPAHRAQASARMLASMRGFRSRDLQKMRMFVIKQRRPPRLASQASQMLDRQSADPLRRRQRSHRLARYDAIELFGVDHFYGAMAISVCQHGRVAKRSA